MTIRYRRPADLRLTELEGEGVVLHLGTRRYFSVSESGLDLLNALVEPRTFDELVAHLLALYEVSEDDARAAVREFLDQCLAARVLDQEPEV